MVGSIYGLYICHCCRAPRPLPKTGPHVIATSIYGAYTGHVFGLVSAICNKRLDQFAICDRWEVLEPLLEAILEQSPYLMAHTYWEALFLLQPIHLDYMESQAHFSPISQTEYTARDQRYIDWIGNMECCMHKMHSILREKRPYSYFDITLGSYLALTGTAIIGAEPSLLGDQRFIALLL